MKTQALPFQTIHLWRASFATLPWPLERLERLLTIEEQARVSRFQRKADQQRMIASRGMLRLLLAHYLGIDPASIPLTKTPEGKPGLAPSAGASLEFSVSHTPQLVVYAFGTSAVGVDVEWVDRPIDWERLAVSGFGFSKTQTRQLPSPEQLRQAVLFAWTAKEAAFKAFGGSGLRSSRALEVGIEGVEPLRLKMRAPQEATSTWQLAALRPAEGHLASICYRAEQPYAIREHWLRAEEVVA